MNEINTWPGWENVELIGEGSFGKVYRIRREEYGVVNEAALKVITIPSSQADLAAAKEEGMDDASVTSYFKSFVEDLAAEFALMSSLKGNSNIVSYEDHMVIPREGEVGWDILIRMELLTPLQAAASRNPLTERDVAALGIDMCRALALCRNRGIIHRDIKPENIFISKDGNYKLGDFGVARVAEKTVSVMSKKGTYGYMAPEVYKSEKYGFAADIYSLGIVLYRYLNNNRLPFLPPYPAPIQYSDRESAIARRIGGEELPPPANGSETLKKAVLKACSYRAEDRYDSAESFMAELESALHDAEGSPKSDNPGTVPEASRLAQELTDEDDFERTMSAVALGQAKQKKTDGAPAKNERKDDGKAKGDGDGNQQAKETRQKEKDAGGAAEVKKDTSKKIVPMVAGLGGLVLVLVVLVVVMALGRGGDDSKEEMNAEARNEQSAEESEPDSESDDFEPISPSVVTPSVTSPSIPLPGQGGSDSDGQEGSQSETGSDSQGTAGTGDPMEVAGQEALAMLDAPTDETELEAHKAAVEKFDGRLLGSWSKVSTEQLGGQNVVDGSYYYDQIHVFETGAFYLGFRKEWARLREEQIPMPVMTVKDGATDIIEAGKIICEGEAHGSNDIYLLMPSITDLSVTYELTDYEPEQDEPSAAFYANDTMDSLTIRIQGNYQDGPLAAPAAIDTLFHYVKKPDLNNWFFPSLEGRWTDGNGFVWAFMVARDSSEKLSAGAFEIAFAMKDASGQVHEGKEISVVQNYAEGTFSVKIVFQDGITVPEYTLVSYDGLTLELEGADGSRLTLKRS